MQIACNLFLYCPVSYFKQTMVHGGLQHLRSLGWVLLVLMLQVYNKRM